MATAEGRWKALGRLAQGREGTAALLTSPAGMTRLEGTQVQAAF